MFVLSMGNLDWGSKFWLNMSQNRNDGKKVHPVEINYFCFWPINPLFLMELTKSYENVKKKCFFFKATIFIKHKIHNFDF